MAYHERTPEFYHWRQAIIDNAGSIIFSLEARLAAKAHEDYYEQLMAEAAHHRNNLEEEIQRVTTEKEGYKVAQLQWQNSPEMKTDRDKWQNAYQEATKEVHKLKVDLQGPLSKHLSPLAKPLAYPPIDTMLARIERT